MNIKSLVFLGLLVAVIFVGSSAASDVSIQQQSDEPITARDRFQLPKLFNFEYFKQIFQRSYANLSEEMRRQKLFLGQAFRAFLSGIKYKHRLSPYYLSVNHMSDWTPTEKSKLKSNVIITEDLKEKVIDRSTGNIVSERPLAVDIKIIGQELQDIKRHSSQPGYDVIADEIQQLERQSIELRRNKRDMEQDARRDFSYDNLIKDKPVKVTEEVLKKIVKNPKSNNLDYEPPEVLSEGILDKVSMPKIGNFGEFDPKASLESVKNLVRETAGKVAKDYRLRNRYVPPTTKEPDVMFNDHRDSGCMNPPSHQGQCGSCYAFAANAYFEYYFCKTTGKLYRFSEQYIIDCAKQVHEVFEGCEGGSARMVGLFYHHAGIELAKNYPYLTRDSTCPYSNVTKYKPKTAPGFFRVKDAKKLVGVVFRDVGQLLPNGPLLITIGTTPDYDSYGGGVDDGKGCCGPKNDTENCGDHAQLLVGDGREDGEEYWLIRNSYGPQWGEGGYYKLNKKSDCIHPRIAFKMGVEELFDEVNFDPRINVKHKKWKNEM